MKPAKNLLLSALILTHLCAAGAIMADTNKEEVDPMAIATVLLKAGQYEKVAQIFKDLDGQTLEPEELNRLLLLKAEFSLQKQDYKKAEDYFRQALKSSQEKDLVRLKLIKTLFLLKRPSKVLYEIVLLTPETRQLPLTLQFEAEAFFLTAQTEEGLAVLAQARQLYPEEIRFPLKRVVVLAGHALAQTAVEEALALLDHPACRPENLLQIAQIFTQQKDYQSAIILLEGARLRLFGTQKIAKALAFNYAQMEEYKLAGEVLYQSGLEQDDINLQSAELFRKAGHYHRAEWMNAQVENQEKSSSSALVCFFKPSLLKRQQP